VETNGNADGLFTRLGLGDGTFGPAMKSNTQQSRISAVDTAFGDLNGDGNLDLVSSVAWPTPVAVMLGVGDGTFAASAGHDTRTGGSGRVALEDLNGDGKLDLISSDWIAWVGHVMTVMLGAGDGTFTCSTGSLAGAPIETQFAFGDLNGDRRMDLVFPIRDSKSIRVLLNQPF
jgi:hypothetical protein